MSEKLKNNKELSTTKTIDIISDIAGRAGDILMSHFKKPINVSFKKDEYDPVTKVDKEADDFIRKQILINFPNDLVLSEENNDIPSNFNGRIWMIDPLDGTKDFLKGRDCFSINIGLLDKGEPVFGSVIIPARSQEFYAEKGQGAFQKNKDKIERIHVSSIDNIEDSRLITRNPDGDIRSIEEIISKIPFKEKIPEGAIGTKICLIATGKAEAHINTNFRASKWDTLGQQVILEEAGGVITDLDGNKLDYTKQSLVWGRSFVASSNTVLNKEIIKRLKNDTNFLIG